MSKYSDKIYYRNGVQDDRYITINYDITPDDDLDVGKGYSFAFDAEIENHVVGYTTDSMRITLKVNTAKQERHGLYLNDIEFPPVAYGQKYSFHTEFKFPDIKNDLFIDNNGKYVDTLSGALAVQFSYSLGSNMDQGDLSNGPRYTITRFPLVPQISQMDFFRGKIINGKYQLGNDGSIAICRALSISIGDKKTASDVAIAYFSVHDISNVAQTDQRIDLTKSELQKLIDGNPYTEIGIASSGNTILHNLRVDVGSAYQITLVIGNAGITANYTVTIYRAFANMHLSGAKNGGVAFGGFSNSTDDEPLFESYFKARFYQGFEETTYKLIGNVIYPVGSIYISTDDSVYPSEVFGGEWEQISDKFLLGAGGEYYNGDIGGATQFSVPMHDHASPVARNGNLIGVTSTDVTEWPGDVGNIYYVASTPGGGFGGITRYSTSPSGAHTVDTMPPYLAVNIWKRTKLYIPE